MKVTISSNTKSHQYQEKAKDLKKGQEFRIPTGEVFVCTDDVRLLQTSTSLDAFIPVLGGYLGTNHFLSFIQLNAHTYVTVLGLVKELRVELIRGET